MTLLQLQLQMQITARHHTTLITLHFTNYIKFHYITLITLQLQQQLLLPQLQLQLKYATLDRTAPIRLQHTETTNTNATTTIRHYTTLRYIN